MPDTGIEGSGQLGDRLVVAVQGDSARLEPGVQGDGELAAGADVEIQTFFSDPARNRRREKRLASVVDIGAREGVEPSPATGAEVVFVDDVGGRAKFAGDVGGSDSGNGQPAVVRPCDIARPDVGRDGR